MNYEHILSKAGSIAWNNRYLWLLGLAAGLSIGTGGDRLNNSFVQGGAWLFQMIHK